MSAATFDLAGPLPSGRFVLEASAGTGKTYSLTALVARYVIEANVPIDRLLVVTFTRAAAGDVRDRAHAVLAAAQQALQSANVPADMPWMTSLVGSSPAERAVRLQRVNSALAAFHDATITTIHGFCQLALGQLGVRAGTLSAPGQDVIENVGAVVREVARDVLLDVLADNPNVLLGPKAETVAAVERLVITTVMTLLTNPTSVVVPAEGVSPQTDVWRTISARAVAEVSARLADRRQHSFDSLVGALHRAVTDPDTAPSVCRQLADQFRVMLVDEFQDTDPQQWDIFERIHAAGANSTLITVGDPKQAIYRFRGADVTAYLNAVDAAAAAALDVNFRSDPAVIAGLHVLFDGLQMGDPRIRFAPVRAAPERVDSPSAGVFIRLVPDDVPFATTQWLSTPPLRRLVLADVAQRVVSLLDNAAPHQIAVLVPSHADASAVANALNRVGVASSRTRSGSVLDTGAVEQWQLLLAAINEPHRAPVVRAAALGWFLRAPFEDIEADSDTLTAIQIRCQQLGATLRQRGVMALFDELTSDPQRAAMLFGQPDGQRMFADAEHVGELLADHLHHHVNEPALALRALADLVAERAARDDTTMRRTDGDQPAVHITTIHAAKGLEFDIVLLPFGFRTRPHLSRPLTYVSQQHGDNAVRVIDVAPGADWDDGLTAMMDREQAMRDDIDGDGLRLLYVAMTRAARRVELWWANGFQWKSSPLARVLLDRDGAGPIRNAPTEIVTGPRGGRRLDLPPYFDASIASTHTQIRNLVADSGGALHLVPVEVTEQGTLAGPRVAVNPTTSAAPIAVELADPAGRVAVDPGWRQWSFTALTAGHYDEVHDDEVPTAVAPDGGDSDVVVVDEGASDDDVDIGSSVMSPEALSGVAPGASSAAPHGKLVDIPGSAAFGTLVHGVLEEVDFAATDLAAELAESCRRRVRRSGLDVDPDLLAVGLADVIRSPLGVGADDRALDSFPRALRMAEVAFDLALPSIDAGRLADVVSSQLRPHADTAAADPFVGYLPRLAARLGGIDLGGWLTGSIDAVLRVGDRFVVVDYKSNRLSGGYHPDSLWAAMSDHDYPLQALLYSVALHRYLGVRLGSRYQPTTHLGGALYLFVRGMTGTATARTADGRPYGVTSWAPPAELIVDLSDALVVL